MAKDTKKSEETPVEEATPEVEETQDNDATPFELFDKSDEEQIENEMKGMVADEMVYSFTAGGQKVEGLSKAGTFEAMRSYNKTQRKQKKPHIILADTDKATVLESENSYAYIIPAYITDDNGVVYERFVGSAEANKTLKGRSGTYSDPFALAKATSKAQRNAIRGLLPDSLIKRLIEKWTKQKRVKSFLGMDVKIPESMVCEDCGKELTDKSKAYYAKNPNRTRLCYPCNQKRLKTS